MKERIKNPYNNKILKHSKLNVDKIIWKKVFKYMMIFCIKRIINYCR